MDESRCEKCKHYNKFIGCSVAWKLAAIHIGRERMTYREPFPKIKIPKGVCKDIRKEWKLEKER